MKSATVRKKCERCGHVGPVPRKQRVCWRQRFGRNSYACNGVLVAVPRPARVVPPPDPVAAWRKAVDRKLRHALSKATEALEDTFRATDRLRTWNTAVKRYQKAAAKTDAEIEADRAARKQYAEQRAARTVVRGIRLKKAGGGQ